MLIFVVNISPARTFWNSSHCLLSPFTLDWARNLWQNPMWNMADNYSSYPIYPLSTRTGKGYITKFIPFFFVQYINVKLLYINTSYDNVLATTNKNSNCWSYASVVSFTKTTFQTWIMSLNNLKYFGRWMSSGSCRQWEEIFKYYTLQKKESKIIFRLKVSIFHEHIVDKYTMVVRKVRRHSLFSSYF